MKKIILLSTLFLSIIDLYAQDITINLIGTSSVIDYTILPFTKTTDNKYDIADTLGIKITINKGTIGSYNLKIKNQSAPVLTLIDESNISVDSKEIKINPDGTIDGVTSANKISSLFSVTINSLKIAFKINSDVTSSSTTATPSVPAKPTSAEYEPSGIIYWDAKILSNVIHHTTATDTILNILSFYSSLSTTKTDLKKWSQAEEIFKDNKFIIEYINEARKTNPSNPGAESVNLIEMFSSAISSVGSLNVTNLSDAFARFLIKRGKEELNVAFFSKLTRFIDKYPEATILFPQASKVLSNIDPTRYSELIQTIRKAFDEDLKDIPSNAYKLLDEERYKKLNEEFPELGIVLRTAHTLSTTNPSDNPVDFISSLAGYPEWEKINSNLGNGFKTLNLISKSLRNPTDSMWVSWKDLQDLYEDETAFNIYLGLLYAQSEEIEFIVDNDTINFQDFLDDFDTNEQKIRDLLTDFVALTDQIKLLANQIKSNKGEVNNDIIYNYLNRTVDIAEYGSAIANRIKPGLVEPKYIGYASQGIEIYKYTYTKDYSSAIFSLYRLIREIVEDPKFDSLKGDLKNKLKTAKSAKSTNQDELKSLTEQNEATNNLSCFIEKLLTFGNFIAGIAKAESPEEIEKVIESSALPAGSSRIKKQANWSVSLNSFVGYYSGKSKNDTVNAWSVNKGITAPIGIAFNNGFHNWGSLSVFASFLNIGSIVDYRLNDDSSSIKQVIHLENIFSPGGYIIYGWGLNLPISFGWGMQYGPRLFKVEKDNLGLTDKPYWRSNWFITIDIPITHFSSSVKRNKSGF